MAVHRVQFVIIAKNPAQPCNAARPVVASKTAPTGCCIQEFAPIMKQAERWAAMVTPQIVAVWRRGERAPYSMEQEVVSVWAGTHGKFDDLEIADVLPFEKGLLDYLDHNTDILTTIRDTENFTADTEAALDKAVDAFRATYVTKTGKPLVEKQAAPAKPTPVEQERIVAKADKPEHDPNKHPMAGEKK